jgi:hypothetical protein
MKINGKITILVNEDVTSIEIKDEKSSCNFLKLELTPNQFQLALSRRAYVSCKLTEVFNLDRIGKKMTTKEWIFKIPKKISNINIEELEKYAKKYCRKGWIPDLYFGSKNSIFYIGEDRYARTTIRRWEEE